MFYFTVWRDPHRDDEPDDEEFVVDVHDNRCDAFRYALSENNTFRSYPYSHVIRASDSDEARTVAKRLLIRN